ncbi:hypothetical protein OIE67_20045 [Nonomuraea fuscirosea]|uniref:hypothetical protein n=1 Tax=Nonomuraea fuscirosea TaxID=1291556 RepID=UPI002DDB1953|nr:hypothetical protein [Nonomuraea fuscirosea]WSA56820.1 hypothetical protein OIE67_20045 [Nonomuraea fuscirosea]
MSTDHDHRASTGPVTVPLSTRGGGPGERITDGGGPPLRSKVTAAIAFLACAACCALPVLIGAGLLIAAAAGMWWLHRRSTPPALNRSGRAGTVTSGDGTARAGDER